MADSERIDIDPSDLVVLKDQDGVVLTWNGSTLRGKISGLPLRHPASPLLQHVASEFDGQGVVELEADVVVGPRFFGAYAIWDIQKAWIEPETDELSCEFEDRLLRDPVLHPLPGREQEDRRVRWDALAGWLGDDLGALCRSAERVPYLPGEEEYKPTQNSPERPVPDPEIISKMRAAYLGLTPEQRAVAMFLHAIHQGAVLYPLALVSGNCTEADYARGVMASQALLTTAFADVETDEHRKMFEGYRSDARTGLDYIKYYRDGTDGQRVQEMIDAGEGASQEFKSTLRWNLHIDKKDDAVTHASIKTIAAFLNTEGGRLLIGVADDGQIVGVEKDGFPTSDRFLLHLTNTVKQTLGETSAAYVTTEMLSVDDKTICVANCPRSPRPVYCKVKGGEEAFYVRTGPGTTALPARKVVEWVQDHFDEATSD